LKEAGMTIGKMPAGATDTKVHIYDPTYRTGAAVAEPNATLADYKAEMARLGLVRAVIVQPRVYGTDNSCMLAAVAALGPAARGIAILDEKADSRQLELLTAQGIVGLHCCLSDRSGQTELDHVRRMAPRVAAHGWHLDLQCDGVGLAEQLDLIATLPGRLAIGNMSEFLSTQMPDSPEVTALLRLLENGRVWVKLSAPYDVDRGENRDFSGMGATARTLLREAPGQCLWASNWPHLGRAPRPDDAPFLDLVKEWASDATTRRRVLSDNPELLYGFGD
jgi:D-galactarolactone isomerase